MLNITIGRQVTVRGHSGVVRFYGSTKFAEGEWVGVELDGPHGRNNGIVQGVKYFECKKSGDYGIFVRPALLNDSSERTNTDGSNVTAIVNKLQSKLKSAVMEISKYKESVAGLETEIEKYKHIAEELEASLENSTINQEHLQSQNDTLLGELESLKLKFEELQHDHSLLREELDLHKDLEEAIKAQELDDAVSKEDFMILVQNNKRLEVAVASVKKSAEETEAAFKLQISQLKAQLLKTSAAEDSVAELQDKLTSSELVVQLLQEQLENVADLDRVIEHLTSENEELQSTVRELTQSVKEFSELQQLEESIENSQLEVETRLKEEVEALVLQVQEKMSDIENLRSINEKLSAENKTTHDSLVEMRRNYKDNELEIMRLEIKKSKAKIIGLDLNNSFLTSYSEAVSRLEALLVGRNHKLHFDTMLQLKKISSYCSVLIEHISGLQLSPTTLRSVLLLKRSVCATHFFSLTLLHGGLDDSNLANFRQYVEKWAQKIGAVVNQCRDDEFDELDSSLTDSMTERANEIQNGAINLDVVFMNLSSTKEELASCKLLLAFAQSKHYLSTGLSESSQLLKDIFGLVDSIQILLGIILSDLEKSDSDLTLQVEMQNPYLIAFNDSFITFLEKCESEVNTSSLKVTERLEKWGINLNQLLSHLEKISQFLPSKLQFNEVKLKTIFMPVLSGDEETKTRQSIESSSSLHSKLMEKELELKDLSLQLEILEENLVLTLRGKQEELEDAQKLNSKLLGDLSEMKKQLEEQVKANTALLTETKLFDKMRLDSMFVQVPALSSIADKKKYVGDMVIIDEIKVLREIVNASSSAGEIENYSWLKLPLYKLKTPTPQTTPNFLFLANRKRKEISMMVRKGISLNGRNQCQV